MFGTDGVWHVWPGPGQNNYSYGILLAVKHGECADMWLHEWKGIRNMDFINGTKYTLILNEKLIPSLKKLNNRNFPT